MAGIARGPFHFSKLNLLKFLLKVFISGSVSKRAPGKMMEIL